MTGNTLIALLVLTAVLQQIGAYIQSVFALAAITDPVAFKTAQQSVIVKGILIILGIFTAVLFQFDLVPPGTFPDTVPPLALTILSGFAIGFGYDFALGLIKAGSSGVQLMQAQVVKQQANTNKANAEAAQYHASAASFYGGTTSQTVAGTLAYTLTDTQIDEIVDRLVRKLEAADMVLEVEPPPAVTPPAPAAGG